MLYDIEAGKEWIVVDWSGFLDFSSFLCYIETQYYSGK